MSASPIDGTTTLNGLRFHFLDWGTRGEPPMLLLHGGAQTAHSWDEVAPDLARDHHVLALDQRGHGDTGWAPAGPPPPRDLAGPHPALPRPPRVPAAGAAPRGPPSRESTPRNTHPPLYPVAS